MGMDLATLLQDGTLMDLSLDIGQGLHFIQQECVNFLYQDNCNNNYKDNKN